MVTEQLYCRKLLCGCFCFIWLWLLIAIMKRCSERCALQLYRTSLNQLQKTVWMLNCCFHCRLNIHANIFHDKACTRCNYSFFFIYLFIIRFSKLVIYINHVYLERFLLDQLSKLLNICTCYFAFTQQFFIPSLFFLQFSFNLGCNAKRYPDSHPESSQIFTKIQVVFMLTTALSFSSKSLSLCSSSGGLHKRTGEEGPVTH